MDEKMRSTLAEELYFSQEAAQFLGVSLSRLGQIVREGRITPVKRTGTEAIFVKEDLDRFRTAGVEPQKATEKRRGKVYITENDLHSPHMQEAINYFTLQSFYDFSHEKTVPVFRDASQKIDMAAPLQQAAAELLGWMKDSEVREEDITTRGRRIVQAFKKLEKGDLIVSKEMEAYPESLRNKSNAPPYLFMRGNPQLLQENILMVKDCNASEIAQLIHLSKYLQRAGVIPACEGEGTGEKTVLHYSSKPIVVTSLPLTAFHTEDQQPLWQEVGEKGLILSPQPPSAKNGDMDRETARLILEGISLTEISAEEGVHSLYERLKAKGSQTDRAVIFSKGFEVQYVYNHK